MEQKVKITNLQESIDWIDNSKICMEVKRNTRITMAKAIANINSKVKNLNSFKIFFYYLLYPHSYSFFIFSLGLYCGLARILSK